MSEKEQHDETQRFHQESGGIVFEKPKSEEEITRETREREQHEFARDQVKTNNKLAWFTGLLVVGTFIGTAISIWQASIAQTAANAALRGAQNAEDALHESKLARQHAAREAQHATELSADESEAADIRSMAALEASAKQNKVALDASIESSRNDQRAWLALLDFKLIQEPTLGQELKVTFSIENTGKTPAVKVIVRTSMSIEPLEPPVPNWSIVEPVDRAIVFPAATIRDVSATIEPARISRETILEYNVMRVIPNSIYLRTRVDYEDVFGCPHWTQACGKHVPYSPADRFNQCLIGIEVDPQRQPHQ